MTRHRELVLASASPRREVLLRLLGVPFTVRPAGVDETVRPGESPEIAARRIARTKAEAVRLLEADAPVLAADTVVVLDGRFLGKPEVAAEAREMLEALRNRDHVVVTGVALMPPRSVQAMVRHAVTNVRMRDYRDAEIEAAIKRGEPFDKAGGYAIQDAEFAPVASFSGCYCNVVGLPLWPVAEMLQKVGLGSLPDASQLLPQCRTCPLRPPVG